MVSDLAYEFIPIYSGAYVKSALWNFKIYTINSISCTLNVSTPVLYRTVEHTFVWLQSKNLLSIFQSSHNNNSQVRNSKAYWSRQEIYNRFSFLKCELQSIIYLHCTWFDGTCQRFLNVLIWLCTKQLQQWKLNAI